MKDFSNKKDFEKQEAFKNIIKLKFLRIYNKDIIDISPDILQFILDNILVIRHQKIIFHTDRQELESKIFNGYIRELTDNSDLIRRKIITKLTGNTCLDVGYRSNKKVIKETKVIKEGLIIVREIIYTTGIRNKETIYSETHKLHIYYGGDSNENI